VNIGAYKIIVSPYVPLNPKMTLAENVPVTKEFRAMMNAWMLEFFGGTEQVIVSELTSEIFMLPSTFEKMKEKL
jgi:hypothetical protein